MQLTFLQIVQRAYQEAGLTGSVPSTVLNQTGRALNMVNWVLQAHEEIQTARADWIFDWVQGTFTLTSGDDTYAPVADFSITGGVREFVRTGAYAYPTASGVNSRLFLEYVEWERFRQLIIPVVPGPPVAFCRRPDGDVQFYPRPNATTTAVMEYYRNPQTLSADADVPRMPTWSHMAIVWKAVMIGCGKNKDFSRFDTAEENYEAIYQRMVREQTPQMVTGGSLA